MRNLNYCKEALNIIKNDIQVVEKGIDNLEMTSEGGPALSDFGRMLNHLMQAGEALDYTQEEIERTATNLRNNARRAKHEQRKQ